MIKLKPTNIFDYYAPLGNSTKIADFEIPKKVIPSPATTAKSAIVPEFPKENSKDKTWLYVLGGAVIIAGVLYYINYKNRQEEEKFK